MHKSFNLHLPGQNGIWVKLVALSFIYICRYVDFLGNSFMCTPYHFYYWTCTCDQNSSFLWGKFIFLKMACARWNFKNIFSRTLFNIIFWPEILKFHPYSILTRQTMVRFVIYCVLMTRCHEKEWKWKQ